MVITTGITVRQMLTPDHLQARVNTAGRMIAGGGLPVGAVLAGLLAEVLPIRLTFGLLTISAVVGAGLAGWSCLGSRPLAAVSVPTAGAARLGGYGTGRIRVTWQSAWHFTCAQRGTVAPSADA